MKLSRLRIVGFKSFVEPSEFLIEPGLTGVVGPNGCGKSNLVEALRWVMGESSHKNMRASGMDDVIFAGSGNRPARNSAEVLLTIDNQDRQAPAVFNDTDLLEVSRRIERGSGSTYRVNGREVRARDVQILFADAATGARSPALVRQGQIAEIIAAKPQARRRILEDAAGIAGLHARRHEAELRLKAAEDNLVRVEDVLREIDSQLESLRRQGRQAARYRNVSAEIRRLEALQFAIGYAEARAQAAEAERQAAEALSAVADRQQEQTEAATAQAVAAHRLPGLREAEAAAAAALQRLNHALSELDGEERRARERLSELERQAADLERDIAREAASRADAEASLARIDAEDEELAGAAEGDSGAEAAARERADEAERELSGREAELSTLQAQVSDLNARRAALERTLRDERDRVARLMAERGRVERDLAALAAGADGGPAIEVLREAVETQSRAAAQAEDEAAQARSAVATARDAEGRARGPLGEAERLAQRLETEARTLAKIFAPPPGARWPRAIDAVSARKGYEAALAAALGEDLDASTDPAAPAHWAVTATEGEDAPLPDGAVPLIGLVDAPSALWRRLAQIGVVSRQDGPGLRAQLRPGQRLVSREGDLWRWDGFTHAAEAPSPAARRLAEKNRLADLEGEAAEARRRVDGLRRDMSALQDRTRRAAAAETGALEHARQIRRELDTTRERLAAAERREAELASRRAGLTEALNRVAASEAEAKERLAQAEKALQALAPAPDLDAKLLEARTRVAEGRAVASEARAALQTLQREAELRRRRQETLQADRDRWSERASRAAAAAEELAGRLQRAQAERQTLLDAPDTYLVRRRALVAEVEAAQSRRREAADELAMGETALAEADKAARSSLEALSAAREARAATQARFEALVQRAAEITRGIADALDTTPAGLIELAGIKPDQELPEPAEVDARLQSLKGDRERLGAVNLRADEELTEFESKRDRILSEREDLAEAIKRLRQAIGSLNREGRERLLAAFGTVDAHFQRLFATLFGGGTAQLTLVDSEDPLEAGLEILARPPGKKPQTMTLLSGGEQALTATALIFAVFLTNPSPICVLDEVDAPLDDANVERYCDLLAEMARETETRFVVITHNPITMARMDRLFGVTMAERGISQLVSVDLQSAEGLREAV